MCGWRGRYRDDVVDKPWLEMKRDASSKFVSRKLQRQQAKHDKYQAKKAQDPVSAAATPKIAAAPTSQQASSGTGQGTGQGMRFKQSASPAGSRQPAPRAQAPRPAQPEPAVPTQAPHWPAPAHADDGTTGKTLSASQRRRLRRKQRTSSSAGADGAGSNDDDDQPAAKQAKHMPQ